MLNLARKGRNFERGRRWVLRKRGKREGADDTRRAQPVQKVENVVGARVVLVCCVCARGAKREETRVGKYGTLVPKVLYLAMSQLDLLEPKGAKSD